MRRCLERNQTGNSVADYSVFLDDCGTCGGSKEVNRETFKSWLREKLDGRLSKKDLRVVAAALKLTNFVECPDCGGKGTIERWQ